LLNDLKWSVKPLIKIKKMSKKRNITRRGFIQSSSAAAAGGAAGYQLGRGGRSVWGCWWSAGEGLQKRLGLLLQTMTRLITSQLTQQQQFYSISLLEKSNIKISPPLMASPRLHGVHATHAVHGVHCPLSSVHPCTPNLYQKPNPCSV
jgi:hypothetical protein